MDCEDRPNNDARPDPESNPSPSIIDATILTATKKISCSYTKNNYSQKQTKILQININHV